MQQFDLGGFGELLIFPAWLNVDRCDQIMRRLQQDIAWQQPHIKVYGKVHKIPRLQAWFGEEEAYMTYSGTRFSPEPWHPLLLDIKQGIENQFGYRFNSALVNLYRDGKDSVSWHADDEAELGCDPVIASMSLGCQREFSLRPKPNAKDVLSSKEIRLPLSSGDLLLMTGATQKYWQHAILKQSGIDKPRINLTYRFIYR